MNTEMNAQVAKQQIDHQADRQSCALVFGSRPVQTVVLGFVGIMGIAMAIAAAQVMGVIDISDEKRGFGLAIGVMAIFVGNFLPKTRGLRFSASGNNHEAAAAERFAGSMLVLTGSVFIASFLFAPLNQARLISSVLGIAAMVMIGANWAWHTRGTLSHRAVGIEGDFTPTTQAARNQTLMANLLLAFAYVFATACAKFLLGRSAWAGEITFYIAVAFWVVFVVLRCSSGLTARSSR